uniref:Uncharacterized protein LOC111110906 isoform X2 n=1 Tax=Crassostrea virginica TaxID=6565 RepID=A0A8B8BKB0_CRAVI|nr:uncharacterized protein LOC111110906 isoform X2 [Crassostrea virginica]
MAKTVQEKRLIGLYVVTIALWLISMFTQGWIVESIDYADRTLISIQTSLFYYKTCVLEVCLTELGRDKKPLAKTMLLIESVLIIRVVIYITTASQNSGLVESLLSKTYKGLTYNIKVPYSIIIAGVGLLAAITGCVLGCVHNSSLKRRNREHQGQNQASAAYAPTVELTNQPHHMQHMVYKQPPYGQPPHGQPPHGQPPHGQPPYGQPPLGQPSYEQLPYGQPPHGQPSYEQLPPGYTNASVVSSPMPMYTK